LKELPLCIGQLNALQELDLYECSNLKEIPSSIGFECIPKVLFITMFQVEITTFIYWPIECTPKVLFIIMFQLEITTFIYWPIECIPRAWFE